MKNQIVKRLTTAIGCVLACNAMAESPISLEKGVPIVISGAQNQEYRNLFALSAEVEALKITISGGIGDPDLYVRLNSEPLKHTYDCRPYVSGNNETCTFNNAVAGNYHIMVHGYEAFSGVSLMADHTPIDAGPDLIDVAKGEFIRRQIEVPLGATELEVFIAGGSGDADLYLRYGAEPTLNNYDCRPFKYGNDERCTVKAPLTGTYHIAIHGYTAASGVSYTAMVHL